ncbi:MAG: TrkH family potassium uptake protein [Fidelibacterota bacterium]
MKYRLILQFLSRISGLFAIAMIPCLLLSYGFREPVHTEFAYPILGMLIFSVLSYSQKYDFNNLSIREAVVIVVISWIVASIIGALPFYLDHILPSFTDSFFESLSGFTATGSTVLPDIEAIPRSILFWRAETHWLGGIGIVVLVMVIFPNFRGRNDLFSSEAPVSETDDRLFPRVATIAKSYWKVYVMLTVLELLLLLPAIGWFDAVTHAFATIAGGGFSIRNASIGFYNSVYVETIVIIFMIAGATSFILHYQVLRGKFNYWKSAPFKIFMGILLSASFLIAMNVYLVQAHEMSFWSAFRKAIFQVTSIITTTGFATADFKYWPDFSVFILIALMFVGGMAASTSGSIKTWRIEIVFLEMRHMLHKLIHRRAVINPSRNGKRLTIDRVFKVQNFIITYVMIFFISGLLLITLGNTPGTSFSAVAATLGNIGPGIDAVGPFDNFAGLSDLSKWILSADMLLGRLEIWTLVSLFVPEFWGLF